MADQSLQQLDELTTPADDDLLYVVETTVTARASDGVVSSGSLGTLTSASALFTAADDGRIVSIEGAGTGGAEHHAVATYVSTSELSLSPAAAQATSSADIFFRSSQRITISNLLGHLTDPQFDSVGIGIAPTVALQLNTNDAGTTLPVYINNDGAGAVGLRLRSATGPANFALGIDNSASDAFKIVAASTLTGADFVIASDGDVGFGAVPGTGQAFVLDTNGQDIRLYDNSQASGSKNVIEYDESGRSLSFLGVSAAYVLSLNDSREARVDGVGLFKNTSSPTVPSGYAGCYSISGEFTVQDDSGNETTVSPHPKDAPPQLYDNGPANDGLVKTVNYYRGEIRWLASERAMRLAAMSDQQKRVLQTHERTIEIVESFADYNRRTGGSLTARDFDAEEAEREAAAAAELAEWNAALDQWIDETTETQRRSGWRRTVPDEPPARPERYRPRARPAGV